MRRPWSSPTASGATRACGGTSHRPSRTPTRSSSSTTWAPAAPTSRRGTRRATAASTATPRTCCEILEALDLPPVVFVGHSVSAMIGVLAAAAAAGAVRPAGPRRARAPATSTTTATAAASARAEIDELLETMDGNYLGWSQYIAPVIMGSAAAARAERGAGEQLLPHRPRDRPAFRPHDLPVRQPRGPRPGDTPALVVQCREDVIAPREVGRVRARPPEGQRVRPLDATGHCPNLSAPGQLVEAMQGYLLAGVTPVRHAAPRRPLRPAHPRPRRDGPRRRTRPF